MLRYDKAIVCLFRIKPSWLLFCQTLLFCSLESHLLIPQGIIYQCKLSLHSVWDL